MTRSFASLLVAWVLAACAEPAAPPVDEAAFPVVRELAAELPLAEVHAETRRIDFGDPGQRAHLLEGWGDDETDGAGTSFVWGLGESSTVELNLLEPRDLAVTARCRAFRWPGAPDQRVTVEVGGREVERLRVGGDFRELRFTLPAETLERGRNRLRFVYAHHRAPREVVAGALDPRPLAVAWDELRLAPATPAASPPPEARSDGLYLPTGTEVRAYLRLASESVLVLPGVEREGAARRLRLDVGFGARGADRVETEARAPSGPSVVGLPAGLVEIRLAALADGGPGAEPSGLILRDPVIRSRPAPRAGAPPAPAPAVDGAQRPHVVVYLVDTLRADHLGCYGYPRPVSPRLDAFAEEAVLFERALAQSSWTRSSVASMMTGTVPTGHGVHDRDDALADGALTLAELLAAAGYETAAFVTNRSVGPSFGFQQGFDTFEFFGRQETEALYPKSDAVNREVFAWLAERLAERRERPFFLYVHTMDPHAPYAPPPATRRRFASRVRQPALGPAEAAAFDQLRARLASRFGTLAEQARLGSVPWLQALHRRLISPTPEMTADLIALYDAEIAFNDLSFGALIDRLRAAGLYDPTLIVFLADHGEEFHDHGSWSHGGTLFEEQLRVPLLVKLPGARRGTRSPILAQHVDLLPTVLEAAGVPVPEGLDGESLLARLDGPDAPPRRGYSHLDLDGNRASSLVEGRFKLICGSPFGAACRLYDLESDPGETTDLSADRPVLAGYLRARMRSFETGRPALEAPDVEIDPQLRERLEALGYL